MPLKDRRFRLAALAIAILLVSGMFAVLAGYLAVFKGVRSRLRRANEGMQATGRALESYKAKYGVYPRTQPLHRFAFTRDELKPFGADMRAGVDPGWSGITGVTTPIAYLAAPIMDPFSPGGKLPFAYLRTDEDWFLFSPGPDGIYEIDPVKLGLGEASIPANPDQLRAVTYDPSNGMESGGDVFLSRD